VCPGLVSGFVLAAALACSSGEAPGKADVASPREAGAASPVEPEALGWEGENLLPNPGFEAGAEGWSIREQSEHWGEFRVVDDPVHSGAGAVHLRLHHGATLPPRRVKVYGVIHELSGVPFPETLGGFYRVERWEKSSERTALYLQAVVIVHVDPSDGSPKPELDEANYQLRYYLTGLDEAPFLLSNAKVAFVSKGQPTLGAWQRFEIPVRDDMERLWGVIPDGASRVSILFEARWDKMRRGESVYADVYYDDLFVGSRGDGGPGGTP